MPILKISQREARRLRNRVTDLESQIQGQRRVWSQDYLPGGVDIANVVWLPSDSQVVAIRTARKLGHAVVAVGNDTGTIRFIALPHPKV